MVWIKPRIEGQPQILLILHQETSTPGRVGMMLQEMGYALDIRRPPLGHELPATLEDHAGAVMFGGPMSANDPEEYVKREIDWIGVPLKEEKPFFGICLGAQMLVKHLGGEVAPDPDGYAEIGYYPLRATNEGGRIMEWPPMIYQWHREGFSLPAGATLLATGDVYENQALRCGKNAFGVQFHAELTHAMLNRWTTRGAHRMGLNGAQDRKLHFEGRYLHDGAVRQWLRDFLQLWVGPASEPLTIDGKRDLKKCNGTDR
jgi:GMP synthase (glutamine-hydrolysing)